MRFNLHSIFVADRGLIAIGIIIVIYSILCLIGTIYNKIIILLMVYYNSLLTIIFLSIFALGALAMNDNLINWIDNHWDVIRKTVFSYDMNTFKTHVTTEINSLGIFSLTINATLIIGMFCISNLLSFKHIIIALSPLTNLIFSVMSSGLVLIGFYSEINSRYATIATWASTLLIFCGIALFMIGIFGYNMMVKMNRKYINYYLGILVICLILIIICCFGFFMTAGSVKEIITQNWIEIHKNLKLLGYEVRKSFLINQIQINLKFAGLFCVCFVIFLILNLFSFVYQFYFVNI